MANLKIKRVSLTQMECKVIMDALKLLRKSKDIDDVQRVFIETVMQELEMTNFI